MEYTTSYFIKGMLTIFLSFLKGALVFMICLTGLIFVGFIFICVREGINIYKEDKAATKENQKKIQESHTDIPSKDV